jgi:hypothetical protein
MINKFGFSKNTGFLSGCRGLMTNKKPSLIKGLAKD